MRRTIITTRFSDEELLAIDKVVQLGYAVDRSDLIRTLCTKFADQVLQKKKRRLTE